MRGPYHACGALVWRRRRPFVVLAVATAGAVVYAGLSGARGWVLAAPLIALYSAADGTGQRRALTLGRLVVLALALTHALARPVRWFGAENLALADAAVSVIDERPDQARRPWSSSAGPAAPRWRS
jgi:hypothetical protein